MQKHKYFIELKSTDNELYNLKEIRFLPSNFLQPQEAQFTLHRLGLHTPHPTSADENPHGPEEGNPKLQPAKNQTDQLGLDG